MAPCVSASSSLVQVAQLVIPRKGQNLRLESQGQEDLPSHCRELALHPEGSGEPRKGFEQVRRVLWVLGESLGLPLGGSGLNQVGGGCFGLSSSYRQLRLWEDPW